MRRSTIAWVAVVTAALGAVACDRPAADQSDQQTGAPAFVLDSAPPPEAYGVAGGAAGKRAMPGRASNTASEEAEAQPPAVQTILPGSLPAAAQPTAMLIRTGNAVLEVDSLEPAVARVRLLAQQLGGYVANTQMQSGHEQNRAATLELKIPSQRFDDALAGLRPIGKVEAVNVSAQDVGEEYVDIAARVANARRLEERLVVLLGTRTGRLQDVLSVERELARVREEIERYEGRMRYLRERSAMSSLAVTVHEPLPLVASAPGTSVIGHAFVQAWRNFVGLVAGLIQAMGVLVPLAVLAFLAVLAWRRYGRRLVPPRPDDREGARIVPRREDRESA